MRKYIEIFTNPDQISCGPGETIIPLTLPISAEGRCEVNGNFKSPTECLQIIGFDKTYTKGTIWFGRGFTKKEK